MFTNNVDVSNNYTYRGPQNTLINNTDETFSQKNINLLEQVALQIVMQK